MYGRIMADRRVAPDPVMAVGSVRSTKTVHTLMAANDLIHFGRIRCHGHSPTVVGRTVSTVNENCSAYMRDIARSFHVADGGRTWVVNGRKWQVRGANDIQAESKISGATIPLLVLDEAQHLPIDFVRYAMSTRLSLPGSRCLATANPRHPTHPLKRDIDAGMWEVWQYRLDRDNPWISPQIKARIIAQQRAAGEVYYRRNILGEWVAAEGRIWNLVEGPMPTDAEASGRWLEIGVDEGHESPSAAVAILPCQDRLVVVGEYWHDPKAAGQHPLHGGEQATRMMAWMRALPWPIGSVWVDPSASGLRTGFDREGQPTRPADNAVLPGIDTVAILSGLGRLQVADAPKLIDESHGYVWDKPTREGVERPLKQNDHLCDGCRYGVHSPRWHWARWVTAA